MDYKEWFEKMSSHGPRTDWLGTDDGDPGNKRTQFWDEMYQMFKARMMDELAQEDPKNKAVEKVFKEMFG